MKDVVLVNINGRPDDPHYWYEAQTSTPEARREVAVNPHYFRFVERTTWNSLVGTRSELAKLVSAVQKSPKPTFDIVAEAVTA